MSWNQPYPATLKEQAQLHEPGRGPYSMLGLGGGDFLRVRRDARTSIFLDITHTYSRIYLHTDGYHYSDIHHTCWIIVATDVGDSQ